MDYGKILSRAWQITWRWKVLWILGFLVSLGNGGGGGGSNFTSSLDSTGRGPGFEIPPAMVGVLVAVACLAILIGIAIWVVALIARGGLIAGVQQVEEEGATTFGRAWQVGVKRFWTLFGIGILTALPILILVFAGIAVFILFLLGVMGIADTVGLGELGVIIVSVVFSGGLCCGAILLGIVLDLIRKYAERAAVLEGLGWIDAFKRGWQVLKANVGPTLVLWLIFLGIGLIIACVILGGIVVVALPFIAIVSNTDPGPWLLVPICSGGLLAILLGALLGSVLETFTSATWTLAYRELTGLAAPVAEPVAVEE